jgi:ABC-type transport system substrate-binding protein
VENVSAGIGKVADGGFIPFGQPGYDNTDKIQAFDVEAAKKLLSESTYASAAALPPIKFTFSSSAVAKTRAEWVQQQWKKNLGVEISLDPVESTVYTQMVKAAETTPQLFFLGWCLDFPHEQNWHSTVWTTGQVSAGRTGYSSAAFDAKTKEADRQSDPAKYGPLYLEAGKILSQDAPAAWVYYNQNKALIKPWVKGLQISARGVTGLGKNEIYIAKH